jgi:hypothetical protein
MWHKILNYILVISYVENAEKYCFNIGLYVKTSKHISKMFSTWHAL